MAKYLVINFEDMEAIACDELTFKQDDKGYSVKCANSSELRDEATELMEDELNWLETMERQEASERYYNRKMGD